MTRGGDGGVGSRQNTGHPPNSTGCGERLGALLGGARGDRRRDRRPGEGQLPPTAHQMLALAVSCQHEKIPGPELWFLCLPAGFQ